MSPAILLILLLYLPLLLLSLFFLIKSLRKKNKSQTAIFFIAVALCLTRIMISIVGESKYTKEEQRLNSMFFEDLNAGDTATFTGWVLFRRYNNKAIQDTINKIERENDSTTGISFFQIDLPDADKKEWHMKSIEMDLATRDSLSKFLNYDQQQKDSITYRFTIKALLKDKVYQRWELIQVIYVDTLKELPHYWQ